VRETVEDPQVLLGGGELVSRDRKDVVGDVVVADQG